MVTKLNDFKNLITDSKQTQPNMKDSGYLEKPKLIKFGPIYQTVCVECECLFSWQKHHLKKETSTNGLVCPGCDVFLTTEQLKNKSSTIIVPDGPVMRNAIS